MRHGSLFSGIGGFDYAAQLMNWENIFHCEWNPFCQNILKYYWPNAKSYNDIRDFNGLIYRGKIDILTGGFPCQPFSASGQRKGTEDNRYLWPQMLRIIGEIKPKWIVGENVIGLTNWNGGLVFEQVCTDLENEGYEILPVVLPATCIGANHQRERIWFIAYSRSEFRTNRIQPLNIRATSKRDEKKEVRCKNWEFIEPASDFHTILERWVDKPKHDITDDGIPERLDTTTISVEDWVEESLKGAGNAIVPQLVYEIFKIIEHFNIHNYEKNLTNSLRQDRRV